MFDLGVRPAGGRPRRPKAPLPPGLADAVRPVARAASRLLPVPAPLAPLFPDGALRRGGTTVVAGDAGGGATTLALALLAAASTSGCWCAAVGLADPGVVAMVELGIDLRRVVFVPRPRAGWADAAATLLDGVDVVLVRPPGPVRLTAARHLEARARERQGSLVVLAGRPGDWPVGPDLVLSVSGANWHGAGRGEGHLEGRLAEVRSTGRRSATRSSGHTLWLPSPAGAVGTVDVLGAAAGPA